jgi:ribosomal protein S18 acetylase RimI-like enzyme
MIKLHLFSETENYDDLIALSREFFREYESYHHEFFKIDNLEDEKIINFFKHEINNKNGKVIVAVDKDRIVGYITFYVMFQDEYWKVKKIGHISGLMVQKEYRHKGIGTRLLKAAKSYFTAKKIKYYTLFTAVENQAALDFYERSGLTPLHMTMLGEA